MFTNTACVALAFALMLLPFVLWDVELFTRNNPFSMQTNKSPLFIVLFALTVAALLSFGARSLGHAFMNAALGMFVLMGLTLAARALTLGWDTAIFSHKFDITYYSTMIPFVVFGYVYGSQEKKGRL